MYITFNIETINSEDWVISSTTFDPTWRLICTLQEYQEWVESEYDMSPYMSDYFTEDHDYYHHYKKVDWDKAGEEFYYSEYINYMTAKKKMRHYELEIF